MRRKTLKVGGKHHNDFRTAVQVALSDLRKKGYGTNDQAIAVAMEPIHALWNCMDSGLPKKEALRFWAMMRRLIAGYKPKQ